MRYYKIHTTILSEDNVSMPKLKRFSQEEQETIDSITLGDGRGETVKIAPGVVDFELPMGQIAVGKWFYLRSEQDPSVTGTYSPDFQLKIDSGAALSLRGKKDCEMWVGFTSLKISNPGINPIRLSYGIAGD